MLAKGVGQLCLGMLGNETRSTVADADGNVAAQSQRFTVEAQAQRRRQRRVQSNASRKRAHNKHNKSSRVEAVKERKRERERGAVF